MNSNKNNLSEFIQTNSPDGGFLQSDIWRKFQESSGRKTFNVSDNNFWANIVEHELPIVGKYLYIPRGPVIDTHNPQPTTHNLLNEIIKLAKKNNIGWVRFDANNEDILRELKHQMSQYKIKKAPHEMQPKELFIIDIAKSEAEILSEMKPKTRYNIKIAQRHNVKIAVCDKHQIVCDRAIDEFVRLVKITAKRDQITPHPDEYYRKMFETIPSENIKLYIAEYDGKIVAANINIFFGKTATYLHGASGHNYKNIMAPYLLQWQAMLHAKEAGCVKYDLGGVMTNNQQPTTHSWTGITRFKTGFSANMEPIKFPGSYDIVINPFRYNLYRILQRIKALF